MRVLERVFTQAYGTFRARIWCMATDLRDLTEQQFQRGEIYCAMASAVENRHAVAADVAEALAELPFCNAVEVTHDDQDDPLMSVLIYPEWP